MIFTSLIKTESHSDNGVKTAVLEGGDAFALVPQEIREICPNPGQKLGYYGRWTLLSLL